MGARQSKTPGPVADVSDQVADVSSVTVDVSNVAVDVSSVAVDVSSQAVDVSDLSEEPRDPPTPQEIVEPSRTTSIFSCCSSLPTVAKPGPAPTPENKDSDVKTEPMTANPENKDSDVANPGNNDTEVAANLENKDSGVGSQDPASA